jgi:hypothetical protein
MPPGTSQPDFYRHASTPRAVAGGSYSAIIQSSRVGPEGGQVLVDETVKAFNDLWPAPETTKTSK